MKYSRLGTLLIGLFVVLFFFPTNAIGQKYDDFEIIFNSHKAMKQIGRGITASDIEIRNTKGNSRALVISVTGRRTLLLEIAYKAFMAGASVIKDAEAPINEIIIITSAQYKDVETFHFSSASDCVIDLYNQMISVEKFTSDCMKIN